MNKSTRKVLKKLELEFREIKVLIPEMNEVIYATVKAEKLMRVSFAYFLIEWESIDKKGKLAGSDAELEEADKEFIAKHLFVMMELMIKVKRFGEEARVALKRHKINIQNLLSRLSEQSKREQPTGDIPTFYLPNSLDIKEIQRELKGFKSKALSKQEEKLYEQIMSRFKTLWGIKADLQEPLMKTLLTLRKFSIYGLKEVPAFSTSLKTHYKAGLKAKGKNKLYVLSAYEEAQRMQYVKLRLERSIRELFQVAYSTYLYELNAYMDSLEMEEIEREK